MHRRPASAVRYLALFISVLMPLAACGTLTLCRAEVRPIDDALILVTLSVSIAAVATWPIGLVAALSTALCFDLILTQPYEHLSIASASGRAQPAKTVVSKLLRKSPDTDWPPKPR